MPYLLFYRLLVMSELFLAEFLFVVRLKKKSYFALRFAACIVVGEGLALVLPLFYNAFYTSVTFLLLFSCTVPMLKFCLEESWKNVFFCGVAAYTTQHFAYGTANFFMTLVQWGQSPIFGMYFEGIIDLSSFNLNTLLLMLVYVLGFFLSYICFYYVFGRKIPRGGNFKVRSTAIMLLVAMALIVDIILNSVTVYFGDTQNITTTLMNTVYENLCCFFLLYIQFGLVKEGELEKELDVAQLLLREQEKQFKLSKESVELINFKCHDLRHQIREIGEGKGLPADAVKQIENAISVYDAKVRTDNEVLDIILTEKSLKCAVNGISLTCVADGRSLEFMDKTDVYTLFGNALDNAIEAVTELESEKRSIGLVVRATGEMVSVSITNYCKGGIILDDEGFPVTTKNDKGFHGIGLRSINKIAEKYNGTSSVKLNGETFMLNVLLSRKTEKNK